MALKTFVKVTNISNLSDARYCAGMGVDLLGFNIDPADDQCVSPELFNEIIGWVAGPQTVGELGKVSPEILSHVDQYHLDYLQLNDLSLIDSLTEVEVPLIGKLNIGSEDDWVQLPEVFKSLQGKLELIIITCDNSELHKDLDEQLKRIAPQTDLKLVKAYDLSESSASDLDVEVFYGIELSGSQEERPGFNDYGDLMDILEVLEED
ncbi:N-(5'-phosphoribosyl)anthranilate isomerase [Marinoscillum sp. MHG1-6]|uniref:N-(5'-phosphoribosyl)anthranilate isomerase n=1 Tax=Marinoscillum sp. MHG1-6 TaxID=2959627 RepID=UPI0021581636|nr:N-(5'-phosphoribosyl)anthranilate isomerase [Marinoscillum sp. MHG1-6]